MGIYFLSRKFNYLVVNQADDCHIEEEVGDEETINPHGEILSSAF